MTLKVIVTSKPFLSISPPTNTSKTSALGSKFLITVLIAFSISIFVEGVANSNKRRVTPPSISG